MEQTKYINPEFNTSVYTELNDLFELGLNKNIEYRCAESMIVDIDLISMQVIPIDDEYRAVFKHQLYRTVECQTWKYETKLDIVKYLNEQILTKNIRCIFIHPNSIVGTMYYLDNTLKFFIVEKASAVSNRNSATNQDDTDIRYAAVFVINSIKSLGDIKLIETAMWCQYQNETKKILVDDIKITLNSSGRIVLNIPMLFVAAIKDKCAEILRINLKFT